MKLVMNGELLKSIFHLTSLYSPWLIIINSSTLHWSTLTTWWGSMFDWFTPSWFRLSVSESLEWVCTKTVFTNGTITRGCEKTYTGSRWILWRHLASEIKEKIPISIFVGGETFSMCFWSDMKGKVLLKINIEQNIFKKSCWAKWKLIKSWNKSLNSRYTNAMSVLEAAL